MQATGLIKGFLRQVRIDLPGGIKWRIDFLVFHADGRVVAEDVKGYETEAFRIKYRQAKELYSWLEIEIVK